MKGINYYSETRLIERIYETKTNIIFVPVYRTKSLCPSVIVSVSLKKQNVDASKRKFSYFLNENLYVKYYCI